MKKQLMFIINPFSGIGQKKVIPQLLEKHLDSNKYSWDIAYTERAKHAIEISGMAAKKGYSAVIGVGGDGSINEVAHSLIHTDTALGIIPGGSGNGIARSLNIPIQSARAIGVINAFNTTTIDTGLLNQYTFVGVAGIGYDALISKEFAERKVRGKFSYALLILKKLNAFKEMQIKIKGSFAHENSHAVLLAFANTPQYGNNAFISPKADPKDGKLKLTLVEKFTSVQLARITQRLFQKTILESSKVKEFVFKDIEVEHESLFAHIDGEPIEVPSKISVRVVPQSLTVIVP